MNAVEFFSILKDVIIAGAAGTTAFIAYMGLDKWQKELRGKANFEVARELIKALYKLRDELSYCRSPFVSASEFPDNYYNVTTEKRSNEDEGQAYAHVYSKRWEPVGKAIQDFDAYLLEAEALWGPTIKEKAKELRQCVKNLRVDIEAFINNKYSGGEDFQDKEYAKEIRASISDMKSKENKLTNEINAAIESLEPEIRIHLSRS